MTRGVPGLVLLGICAQGGAACPGAPPWELPAETAKSDDERAWRLFVALNAPQSSDRRAGARACLRDEGAVVWEGWRTAREIFRDDGGDPGPRPAARTAEPLSARFEGLALRLPGMRHIVKGRMVTVSDPLATLTRLVEIRINPVSDDYIRAHRLYSLAGQQALLQAGQPVRFPPGALHVKASWRVIAPQQQSRYHTLWVRDGRGRRLYGLTALNIAVKDRPHWLWVSFEHEDNEHRTAEGWQLPSRDQFACPEAPVGCQKVPQGLGLEGTVWQHYRLRGTMSRYVDAEGRPARLASSELEAGLQASSSCITCHARASLGTLDGQPARLPVLDAAHRGHVGAPDPAWWGPEAGARFLPMDFVWSLSHAAPSLSSSFLSGDTR